jgi:ATP adenylyltransferase
MALQSGPVSRTRTSQRRYVIHKNKSKQSDGCDFCNITDKSSQFVRGTRFFNVITNIFGYDVWDGCRVTEHLMLIPKRHIHSLGELTSQERERYAKLISEYEAKGYSLYSRAADNITKSVAHQHTHLIKLEPRRKKFLFYIRTPHLLLFK